MSDISPSSSTLVLADPEDADEGGDEPQQGRQEGKRNVCLEPATGVSPGSYIAPVEDVAAVVTDQVDKKTKRCPPAETEYDVHRPVDEGPREGEQPYDGEQDGQSRDDFGVDEAAEIPGTATGVM